MKKNQFPETKRVTTVDDEDGQLKEEVAEEIEERRENVDLDKCVPHEEVKEEFLDNDEGDD